MSKRSWLTSVSERDDSWRGGSGELSGRIPGVKFRCRGDIKSEQLLTSKADRGVLAG